MQTTSARFTALAQGPIRPLSWELRASFDKTFDSGVDFFTLDTSLLDGADVLAPSDNNIIALWDKYSYADYSDRVISIETSREILEPYSVVQSIADVKLKNEDNYFTPNSGSPIDAFILPKRPFRLLMGFGGETVQVFVGLSEKMPEIDKESRTASFHLIDFLTYIFGNEIIESTMLLDYSTSEILDVLFQSAGLLPNQYVLDDSFNRIPYFFVSKGDSMGKVIQDLMEAEQGRLYLDELGIIRFLNRQNYNTSTVYSFDKSNTVNYSVSNEDDIINYAKITIDVLAEYPAESVWVQSEPTYIAAGDTIEIWANLNDPSTNVTSPVYSADSIDGSYFTSSTDIEGDVPYLNVSLNSLDLYGTAAKLTFENTGLSNAYIYAVELWGTPVKTQDKLLIESKDQDSIDKFDEKVYEFETKYIQTKADGITKAAIMVDDYKAYGSLVDLDVKGSPALQIDDAVALDLDGYQDPHIITKIENVIADRRFSQRLRAKIRNPRTYFILDQSLLDGSDVLQP